VGPAQHAEARIDRRYSTPSRHRFLPYTTKNTEKRPPGLLTTLFASETLLPHFCILDCDLCHVTHPIQDKKPLSKLKKLEISEKCRKGEKN
jgi:hypothetical protein